MDIMLCTGIFLLIILVSFIMSCRNKAKGKKDGEDSDEDISEMAKQKGGKPKRTVVSE